jgi:PAS domain S-box-containing protein
MHERIFTDPTSLRSQPGQLKKAALDLQKIIERLIYPPLSIKEPELHRRVRFLSSLLVILILAGITAIIQIIFKNSPIFNVLIGIAIAFLVGILCALAIVVALIQYQKFNHIERQPQELSNDIIELQHDREALKQSEARYRDLLSRLPAALYHTSMEGQILDANLAFMELLGYPDRETLLKVNVKDIFMDPKDRVVENAFVVIEGAVRGFRLQLRRFDGRRIWVRDTFRIRKDTIGNTFFEGSLEDITEQVHAEEINNKNASRNQILAEISGSIVKAGYNHQAILDVVTNCIGNWIGGGCFIVNLRVSGRQFQLASLYHPQPDVIDSFRGIINIILNKRFASGGVSISTQTSLPMSIEIMEQEKILDSINIGYWSFLNQYRIHNILFIPICAQNEVIGHLGVVCDQPGFLHQDDQAFLQEVANRTSLVIMNAYLYEEAQRNLSRLDSLRQIDIAITATLDLRVSLGTILDQAMVQTGVDAANVLVLNPHTYTFDYVVGKGFRTKALQNTHLRFGEGYAGRAAMEQKILNIPNLREKETDLLRSPYFLEESFISYYAVPLIAMGEVKGVLELFHRSPLNPNKEWLDFLEALAGQAAIAIDSVGLFKDLQRSNHELITAYDATIEGWSRALDLRDRETEGHTRRVTEITLRLARKMGVNEVEQVHMRRGAILHDIGKMGIPDNILLKPGPLTGEEWQVMRKHPVYAYEMLIPINYLRPALDIPYCHHEKWDGTGYPRGLKGDQIPLVARIFAIVDVWDALCSERPYRSALSEETVRRYIQEQTGLFFDPNVAKAFFNLINGDNAGGL